MTQNTEHEVKTRDELEQELAILICKAGGRDPFQMTYHTVEPGVMEPFGDAWCHYIAEAKAVLEWHEAEARGAAKASSEKDLLIRDLRKELNERRYGRSIQK